MLINDVALDSFFYLLTTRQYVSRMGKYDTTRYLKNDPQIVRLLKLKFCTFFNLNSDRFYIMFWNGNDSTGTITNCMYKISLCFYALPWVQ